jgi:hypothetical protein
MSLPAENAKVEPAGQERLPSGAARRDFSLAIPLLISVIVAVCSVAWLHGGFLQYEGEARLPYYLSDRSLPAKLYDSDYLEMGMYQARELSYLFDYIDCKFIAGCVALGHPHFLSVTHYFFLIWISVVFWRFGVDDLKMNRWTVAGALLLVLTTPVIFLSGGFYRTAKIGVALALAILYRQIFRNLRAALDDSAWRMPMRTWLSCFGWAWAATLFDREGLFMVGVMVVLLGLCFFGCRQKNMLKLADPLAAAGALSVIYNYILAPVLTYWLNGYWPDFKYQHLPWKSLAEAPGPFAQSGLSVYLDLVRFLLGNIPSWAAALCVLGMLFLVAARKSFRAPAWGLFLGQTVLVWAMIVLMALRLHAVVEPVGERVYYYLPVMVAFGMTLLVIVARISSQPAVMVLLAAALVGNIVALPRHNAIIRGNEMTGFYEPAAPLLDALRNLRAAPHPVSAEMANDRIYRFFRDGYVSRTYPGFPGHANKP